MNEITLNYHIFLYNTAKRMMNLDRQVQKSIAVAEAKTFQLPRNLKILQASTITRHSDIRVAIANDLRFIALVLERASLSDV